MGRNRNETCLQHFQQLTRNTYQCLLCDRTLLSGTATCQSTSNLRAHLKSRHKDVWTQLKEQEPIYTNHRMRSPDSPFGGTSGPTTPKRIKNESVDTRIERENESELQEALAFGCTPCGIVFVDAMQLVDHLQQMHNARTLNSDEFTSVHESGELTSRLRYLELRLYGVEKELKATREQLSTARGGERYYKERYEQLRAQVHASLDRLNAMVVASGDQCPLTT